MVDECQDFGVPHLRFLAALAGGRPDGLFFTGDLGQRIFQLPFSWKSLGIDIRGRSRTLTVNYRTSHQIRGRADRLLGGTLADVDGNVEQRGHTVSVSNGPEPVVDIVESEAKEAEVVGAWLRARSEDGLAPDELALFVRSPDQIERASACARAASPVAEPATTSS